MLPIADVEAAIRSSLKSTSAEFWTTILSDATERLLEAQDASDEITANKAWFLKRLIEAKLDYLACFDGLKAGEYYEAWCTLERIEIEINSLLRNQFYLPDYFLLLDFKKLIETWQKLYPYKVFLSPGFLHKRVRCGVCQTVITPWSTCCHERGRVYMGVECIHLIEEVEITEISIVSDPVQKYSVLAHTIDENGNRAEIHDYALIQFLISRLNGPYDGWSFVETTALHPHTMFPQATPDGACPCQSGKSYESCCMKESGVKRPHYQFQFEVSPPDALAYGEFAGYGDKNGPADIHLVNHSDE